MRAPPRLRALFRVQAAGFWAFFVDRAAARVGVQKTAVAAGTAGHGEDVVFGVVVVNQLGFEQALCDQFVVHVVHLKLIDQLKAHQVAQLHFQRHGAAVGAAGFAHAGFVFAPGFEAVNVHDAYGGFHGVCAHQGLVGS